MGGNQKHRRCFAVTFCAPRRSTLARWDFSPKGVGTADLISLVKSTRKLRI